MFRYLVLIPICLVTMTIGQLVSAAPHGHRGHGSHCCTVCPRCETCCEFTAEATTEEKTCFTIECEEICVPRVVFPWQTKKTHPHARGHGCDACATGCGVCTCVNNGAWVRTVKKLKKQTYKCPTCKYEWTAKKVCRGGCCDGGAGCADGASDAGLAARHDPPAALAERVKLEQATGVAAAAVAQPSPLPRLFRSVSGTADGVKAAGLGTLKKPLRMFKRSERK